MKVTCHCGDVTEILVVDKRGFVCDVCGGLFDVNTHGVVMRSPLRNVLVVETGSRPDWRGQRGTFVENNE